MQNRRILFTMFLLLIAASSVRAQNRRGAKPSVSRATMSLYEPGEFKGVKYRLMKPIDFDPNKTYPLILSLHGAGGKGNDNIKNLRNWNEWLTDQELRRKHPCFVLAPQSPTSWFDPSSEYGVLPDPGTVAIEDLPQGMKKFGQRALDLAAEAAENPNDPRVKEGVVGTVLEFIDTRLSKQYKIDEDRVYCLGHSMGGAGTFTAVYQHPERFAAAIPSAGIFFPWLDAGRIKDVPLWIFHGKDDNVVNYAGSRHPFERLKKLGANAKFTTVKGAGHGSNRLAFNYTGDDKEKGFVTEYASDRVDKTDHVWDWLFAQNRGAADATAKLKRTLSSINAQFENVDVQLVVWPDALQPKLGKLKKVAFIASPLTRPPGKMPLLIALHGGGGKTMSLDRQLARSAEVKGLHLAEHAGRSLVLLEPNAADSWDAIALNAMLDHFLSNHPEVDSNRVYVMGHSMGGVGTWDWINESPERFAAAAPCGFPGSESVDSERLKKLPIWGMAGGDDGERTTGVKKLVEDLRSAGNVNVRHTEFAGANHSQANAAVFSSVELVDWMLSFSKDE